MIKALEIDVEGIEQNGIIADIGNNLKLDLIYNNVDSYIYVSILDSDENRITGFFRLVPDINFLSLVRIEKLYQLRCIKINDFAEERDKITPQNLNKDYKFFLIGDDNG
jgi:hypothetical protein fuD12_06018